MPIRVTRYKHDAAGVTAFMNGPELGEAVTEASQDVVAVARSMSSTLAGNWDVEVGPPVLIEGLSRLTRNVTNDHEAAAAIEFGSGVRNRGATGANVRPQGGYSDPQRILGTAGARVGDYQGEPG